MQSPLTTMPAATVTGTNSPRRQPVSEDAGSVASRTPAKPVTARTTAGRSANGPIAATPETTPAITGTARGGPSSGSRGCRRRAGRSPAAAAITSPADSHGCTPVSAHADDVPVTTPATHHGAVVTSATRPTSGRPNRAIPSPASATAR